MDKYGTLNECPKCGSFKFFARFEPADYSEGLDGTRTQIGEDEHMLVTCDNCGYEHKEAPLDKFPQEKKDKVKFSTLEVNKRVVTADDLKSGRYGSNGWVDQKNILGESDE